MPSFTVKNIPEPLYKRLKKMAHLHHRSINSEIIETLEKGTTAMRVDPETISRRARQLRARVSGELTDAEFEALKNQGRVR